MAMRGKSILRLFGWILAVAAVVVGGLWAARALLVPTVSVTEVTTGPVVAAFYSTGTVAPEREYPIRASVDGIVEHMWVDKGDPVTPDQILASVSDPARDFAVKRAQAELDEKRALAAAETSPALAELDARITMTQGLVEIAEREQGRLSQLVSTGAASPTDLDRAMDRLKSVSGELAALRASRAARVLELDRQVKVAEAALETARAEQAKQAVKSPVQGVVLDRPTPVGTRVGVNDHLMQVADVAQDKLLMRAQVDEEDIDKVSEGQDVRMTLYAFDDRVFSGSVKRVYDKADEARRTFEVDVEIDRGDARLAAGMTGELAFILDRRSDVMLVPAQAVSGNRVWVVRGGRAEPVEVDIGIRSVTRVEIKGGLAVGDTVVLSPTAGMSPGTSVKTARIDPNTAARLNEPATEQAFKGGF